MHTDSAYLIRLLIFVPPVIVSLCMHELMHAWMAWRCGDPTAKDEGRLTLNPLAHLDWLGTLALLFAPIGWAKPVPVMPENFRHRRLGEILVALAGVTSNFVLALVLSLGFRWLSQSGYEPVGVVGAVFVLMLYRGILVNFGLAIFNLLPIAPLDGHHVVRELLPSPARERFMEYSRYGLIILLGLVILQNGAGMKMIFYPVGAMMNYFAGPNLESYLEKAMAVLNEALHA